MPRTVRCFPSDDHAFADAAAAALRSLASAAFEDVGPALADLLRPTFRNVAVRRQHALAQLDGAELWYAFRDGDRLRPA